MAHSRQILPEKRCLSVVEAPAAVEATFPWMITKQEAFPALSHFMALWLCSYKGWTTHCYQQDSFQLFLNTLTAIDVKLSGGPCFCVDEKTCLLNNVKHQKQEVLAKWALNGMILVIFPGPYHITV